MRMKHGLPIFATVLGLLAGGCSSEQRGSFRHAKDEGTVADPKTETERTLADANRKRQPVVAPKPGARQQPFETGLTAAVGFGGAPIVSDTYRLSAERRLPPAIGVSPTLLLVAKVDGSIQSTSIGQPPEKKQKREVKLLIPERDFQKEGGAYRITYDDLDLLKILNMEPVTAEAPRLLPDWLKELDGERVRIRGFMSPAFRSTGLRGFAMGRDNKACCFPGRAKIYDLFPVVLKKGTTTNYIQNRPFDVVGTFQIKPWIVDGEILRIYRIVDAEVIQ